MICHVCSRAPTPRLRLFCPTCARNQLYQLRIENAKILLEEEYLRQQIDNAVCSSHFPQASTDRYGEEQYNARGGDHTLWIIKTTTSEKIGSSIRTKALATQVENLQDEIKNKKCNISQRRLALARRRSDAESAKYQLADRETAMLSSIQNNTKRTDHLWHTLHSRTAEARIFLCREAANLYDLRQRMKKKDGEVKEVYTIGGIPILDLRDMNGKSWPPHSHNLNINRCAGATPTQISTSFCYIAHLLVLISHYLSLRLPAEVTLPHKNYPAPTVYALSGSYVSCETSSTSNVSQSSLSSPASSRTADSRSHLPRARPLSTDRNLPKLAREDPANYALFIEGATLLAWNVAWICRTQGIQLASDSWEEICDVGRNMWHLLVAPPTQASTLNRAFAGRDIQPKVRAAKDSPKTIIQRTISFPMLGHYSHGTVHSFLAASEGTEFVRTWKLPTPTKVSDKLRSSLLGEMASAEWEVLEEKEWDDEPQTPTQYIHRFPMAQNGNGDELNLSNTEQPGYNSTNSGTTNTPPSSNRLRGTSGWTKLRNR
ncbi:UV radiation resistance protein and autophagy-related subunit 14-domain-containing protein [Aspergillus avenaceus]|uniref:Autophagy-related protein 14 n=1 Tax=Aspergillus avenaceus TaxID=36643 RepID=A0A5N6TMH8_ASPAV|nr:UV radiation resistance protein and autophagy-related subunit 14-domain-containing protein [Aspergillus avenaceus]